MIIVTKDNQEYYPLLFGSVESEAPTQHITCIKLKSDGSPELDLFGRIAHYKIHIKELKEFKGSYSLATPFNNPKPSDKNNG
jgi:hypothetical protein